MQRIVLFNTASSTFGDQVFEAFGFEEQPDGTFRAVVQPLGGESLSDFQKKISVYCNIPPGSVFTHLAGTPGRLFLLEIDETGLCSFQKENRMEPAGQLSAETGEALR